MLTGGTVIGMFFGFILGMFLSSFILQYIIKIIFKFKPKYNMVLKTVIVSDCISFCINFIIGFTFGFFRLPETFMLLPLSIVSLFLPSYIYGIMIYHPGLGKIGFKKGLIINFIKLIIGIILCCLIYSII